MLIHRRLGILFALLHPLVADIGKRYRLFAMQRRMGDRARKRASGGHGASAAAADIQREPIFQCYCVVVWL